MVHTFRLAHCPLSLGAPMTITYEIRRLENLILEKWSGEISIDQLRRHWSIILHDDCVMKIRTTLVDLRSATIGFSDAELDLAVKELVLPALGGREWITAIVVNTSRQPQVGSRYHSCAARYRSDVIASRVETA